MKIKTLREADTVHTPAQIIQAACCFSASQLGLGRPRRDEEVFSQRLRAEEAVAEHQPPPDDGGVHDAPQGGAQVRSQLQTQNTHTHTHRTVSSEVTVCTYIIPQSDVRLLYLVFMLDVGLFYLSCRTEKHSRVN